MKKLSKLSIDPNKIIKKEDLLNLKGGNSILKCCDDSGGYACWLSVTDCGGGFYNWELRQYCIIYCGSSGATGDWECVD